MDKREKRNFIIALCVAVPVSIWVGADDGLAVGLLAFPLSFGVNLMSSFFI